MRHARTVALVALKERVLMAGNLLPVTYHHIVLYLQNTDKFSGAIIKEARVPRLTPQMGAAFARTAYEAI